jgi:hypothetical protein
MLLTHCMKSLSSGYLISSALIWLDGAHVPDRKFSGGGNNGMFVAVWLGVEGAKC